MNTHFKAIHEQYVFWLDTLGFATETVCNYGYRVTDFFLWLESKDITHIVQAEQKHINDFFDCQQTRPNTKFKGRTLSASYLNDYFTAIDKLCEFLHQMGARTSLVPTNRRITIDESQRIRRIEPFTVEEIKMLQEAINHLYPHLDHEHRQLKQEQLKLVFVLFYACGLRLSEGYNLTPAEIDFNRKNDFYTAGQRLQGQDSTDERQCVQSLAALYLQLPQSNQVRA